MHVRNKSFLRSRLIFIAIVAALVLLGALWVFGPGRMHAPAPTPTLAPAPPITFTPPPDLKDLAQQFPRLEKILTNPVLDSVYKDFLVAYERGGVEAAELLARQRGLLTPDNQIRVTLVLDTQDPSTLVHELQGLGVMVRGTYRDLIDIGIPLELIVKTAQSDEPGRVFDQITQLEHVIGLQLPATSKPNKTGNRVSEAACQRMNSTADNENVLKHVSTCLASQPMNSFMGFLQLTQPVTISEGVKVIGADAWHQAGYTGKGVKIGILDQGFDGYRDLVGRSLPFNVTVKSFVPGIDVDKTGIAHGAAVAEVIHDVAPDAELYLAYYDGGDVSMGNAVEWLIDQGVQIISHSSGGLAAPMDGTGRDDELVDRAARAGVLWVNSAGNNGTQHYRAPYTDTNNDGVHEFAPDQTLLGFQADPSGDSQIVLTWDDWKSGGDQALDLFLLDRDGSVIASSRNSREGNHPPVQQIVYQFDDARTYYVAIHGVNVTRPLTMSLFIHQTPNMEFADPVGSLATPGDAKDALTVGAVYWLNNQLEPFSSRGPTSDGRIKPDLVGPDGVSNAVYAPNAFYGTSAATPHIAGAAALVLNAYPNADAKAVRDYLISNAIDLQESGLDNETGAGLLLLPAPPPTQPAPSPTPGGSTTPGGAQTAATLQPTLPGGTQTTATRRPIVIGTPARPRPAIITTQNDNGNWIGLIAIGLALALAGFAGWRTARHARHGLQPTLEQAGQQLAMPSLVCAYCGYVQSGEAQFCPQCGRPVSGTQPSAECAHCHRRLRPGANYCGHCGQAI